MSVARTYSDELHSDVVSSAVLRPSTIPRPHVSPHWFSSPADPSQKSQAALGSSRVLLAWESCNYAKAEIRGRHPSETEKGITDLGPS